MNNLRQWKSTAVGLIGLLVTVGLFTPDLAATIQEAVPVVEEVAMLLGSLYLMFFSKD